MKVNFGKVPSFMVVVEYLSSVRLDSAFLAMHAAFLLKAGAI